MEVVLDILEGSQATQKGDTEITLTRVALVKGVTGNADERIMKALNASGLPKPQDPLPGGGENDGIVLLSRSARPLPNSNEDFLITLTYGPVGSSGGSEGDKVQMRLGGSVQSGQTDIDHQDTLIVARWELPSGDVDEQPTTVEKQFPQLAMSLSRTEGGNLIQRAQEYVGKINDSSFYGGAERTWLCTRIDAQSDDGGKSFRVDYEFVWNPDTWDAVVAYRNQKTGKVVLGATPAPEDDPLAPTGINRWQIYETADFNALGLV